MFRYYYNDRNEHKFEKFQMRKGVLKMSQALINAVTKGYLKTDVPSFRPGDNVRVHVRIKEGDRERIQIFEGLVIARRGGGISETYTVRKISSGVGVEIHSRLDYKPDPTLENVFVLMSAYRDGEYLIPVKLEVKKFKDKQNTLYVAIFLEKIKMTEV